MSLVASLDFIDDLVDSYSSGENITITNNDSTISGINTIKYKANSENISETTVTYNLKASKLDDYIFSNTDIINLKFDIYVNLFNVTTDYFNIEINDNNVFYHQGSPSVSNKKFTINYLFKSSELNSILSNTNPTMKIIFVGLDGSQSEYVLLDKNFELYAIYKPEFSDTTDIPRTISNLNLNNSFDASSKTIANANACEIKGLSTNSPGEVTFNLKNKLLDNKPVSLFFNLNVEGLSSYVVTTQDTLRIKVSNGPKISLTESETSMLQTEFIATTENETISTWYANYVKEGSNGSNSLTNSSSGFEYNSDANGPYFLVNSSSVNVTLQNYPNQSYLFNMDSTSGAVLCYEIWCYYSGDDGTISNKGWLMGAETGWGPYIILTDSRIGGIGTSPGATDNNTYSSLTNPGYIDDNANKGQLLHIVGYWEQDTNSNHERGVYINGTHYPQETTSQSGRSNYPGFDNFNIDFQVGGRGSTDHSALGVRIYSFRIWHGDIRSKVSTLYDAGPHASVITNYRDILELNSSNNDELKTLFYTQTENYDSYNNFNVKFSLTGNIGTTHYVYFEDMFTYVPEAINFFDDDVSVSGKLDISEITFSTGKIGEVKMFITYPLPYGFIPCNGQTIQKSDDNKYEKLIHFLSNNTSATSVELPNYNVASSIICIDNKDYKNDNVTNESKIEEDYIPIHNHSTNITYNPKINFNSTNLGNNNINLSSTFNNNNAFHSYPLNVRGKALDRYYLETDEHVGSDGGVQNGNKYARTHRHRYFFPNKEIKIQHTHNFNYDIERSQNIINNINNTNIDNGLRNVKLNLNTDNTIIGGTTSSVNNVTYNPEGIYVYYGIRYI